MIILGEKYNKGILTWIPFFYANKKPWNKPRIRKLQKIFYLSTLIL